MRLRQLIADDRKLAECRLQDLALQFGVADEARRSARWSTAAAAETATRRRSR